MVLTLGEANRIVEVALAAARQSHSKVGVAMVLCRKQKIVGDTRRKKAAAKEAYGAGRSAS